MTPTLRPQSRRPFAASCSKLGALCSAAAVAVALGYNPAQAQTATYPVSNTADPAVVQLDTFEVTGIRSSVTKALDVKRTSVNMVDAIVAEDIGKVSRQPTSSRHCNACRAFR